MKMTRIAMITKANVMDIRMNTLIFVHTYKRSEENTLNKAMKFNIFKVV